MLILIYILRSSSRSSLQSKYDGGAWGEFAHLLSLDLLHHINGNGVYNVTDPLLLNMISEIEAEAGTIFNAVPFDLRISQMMLEAATGAPCPFLFNTKKYHIDLPSKVDKFTSWWAELASGYEPVKESNVVSNMASMVYKPSEVERYSLVHGKMLYFPWDSEKYGVSPMILM